MPKVSIIVPVYNVEKYLPRCLDSLIAQTFKDWECILIDDGSPDNSGTICESYATIDSRFKVFHKENEGVSVARNYALDRAQGHYATFIDSDDWIEKDCLEICIREMEIYTLDLLQFGYKRVSSSGKILNETVLGTPVEKKEKFIEFGKFNVCVGGAIYCLDVIQHNRLRFMAGMKLGEDQLFFFEYLKHACKMRSIPQTYYCYFLNYSSATVSAKSPDVIRSMKIIGEYAASYPLKTDHFAKVLNSFLYNLLCNFDVSGSDFVNLYNLYYCPSVLNRLILYTKISKLNPYFAYYICGFFYHWYLQTRTLAGYVIHKIV